MNTTVYYGTIECEVNTCKNKAYWKVKSIQPKNKMVENLYLCGVHSRKCSDRKELKKLSKTQQESLRNEKNKERQIIIDDISLKNRKEGKKGNVIISRLMMMKEAKEEPGYIRVYPNFKHQNKKDGYGCMKLSPKYLGPVDHGQPGLPKSENIENFHQGSKCFQQEVDEAGNPSDLYYKNRLSFYQDKEPHRHKYKGIGENKNIPLCFIWIDKEGKEHRLSYIESRQFYCAFYERLATKEPDYLHLNDLLSKGFNLQIIGYDGCSMEGISHEEAYLDPSKPFGHEKVLYTLLTIENPEEYPWRKYKTFDF